MIWIKAIVINLFYASIAQLVEQLICNQLVVGSSPSAGSKKKYIMMGGFQSGQMGQTVNLLLRLRRFESFTSHFFYFPPSFF